MTRATNAENGLSSRITVTEEGIKSTVKKGEVSSEISQESGKIRITSNRLEVDSDNFKLDSKGNVSITGIINATGGKIGGLTIDSLPPIEGSTEPSYRMHSTISKNDGDYSFYVAGDGAWISAIELNKVGGENLARLWYDGRFVCQNIRATGYSTIIENTQYEGKTQRASNGAGKMLVFKNGLFTGVENP